jgi:hypothetical protein
VIGYARLPDGDGLALVEELGPALGCDAAVVFGPGRAEHRGAAPPSARTGVRHVPGPLAPEDLVALLDGVGR